MRRRGHPGRGVVVKIVGQADAVLRTAFQMPVEQFDNTWCVRCAHEKIDFGQLFLQFLLVALRHAAADDQQLALAVLLLVGDFENGFDRFLLGVADKGAGVDHDDIRLAFVGDDGKAFGGQVAEHDFGIDKVFRAAQADQADIMFRQGRVLRFSSNNQGFIA